VEVGVDVDVDVDVDVEVDADVDGLDVDVGVDVGTWLSAGRGDCGGWCRENEEGMETPMDRKGAWAAGGTTDAAALTAPPNRFQKGALVLLSEVGPEEGPASDGEARGGGIGRVEEGSRTEDELEGSLELTPALGLTPTPTAALALGGYA